MPWSTTTHTHTDFLRTLSSGHTRKLIVCIFNSFHLVAHLDLSQKGTRGGRVPRERTRRGNASVNIGARYARDA